VAWSRNLELHGTKPAIWFQRLASWPAGAPRRRARRKSGAIGGSVIVADLDTDPLWHTSMFRVFMDAHGLRSIWSAPIRTQAGQVLGALAILQDQPATPMPQQENLRLAQFAGIVVERAQAGAALGKAQAELKRIETVMALGASIAGELTQPLSGVVINTSTGLRMLTADRPDIERMRETLRCTLRDCARASEMVTQLRGLLHSENMEASQALQRPGEASNST
jgi:hypothetical protein